MDRCRSQGDTHDELLPARLRVPGAPDSARVRRIWTPVHLPRRLAYPSRWRPPSKSHRSKDAKENREPSTRAGTTSSNAYPRWRWALATRCVAMGTCLGVSIRKGGAGTDSPLRVARSTRVLTDAMSGATFSTYSAIGSGYGPPRRPIVSRTASRRLDGAAVLIQRDPLGVRTTMAHVTAGLKLRCDRPLAGWSVGVYVSPVAPVAIP